MGKLGFRDVGTDPFVYEEIASGSSAAVGLDNSDSDKFKIAVSATAGATPSSTAQFTIDQSANGNITLDPNGSGATVCASGDLTITAGNFNLPATNGAGTEGVILVNSTRFISSFTAGSAFFGPLSGNTTLTGGNNIGIGSGTMDMLTTGAANTSCGAFALNDVTTGDDNVAVGNAALSQLISGDENVCVGQGSGESMSTGTGNVLLGFEAANSNLTTGTYNICVGHQAGQTIPVGSTSNIMISNTGNAVTDNNTIRIGTHGAGSKQQNRCFIAGIRGITTANANAIPVLVDSAHQLGTVSSSARYKENIQDLGDQSEIIYDLKPKAFNFKGDESKTPAWGLIAEEVEAIFPSLVIYDEEENRPETVRYHDLPVLLLNELKKLKARVDELEKASCCCMKSSLK